MHSQARGEKWWMLTAISIATFMLLLDLTVVNVALPSIRRDLDASFSELQWAIDAYILTLAALLLTAGSLADRLGRRRVLSAGLVIFTAASALCALSTSALMLDLARGVQGAGGAVMYAVAPAMIAQDFHGRERATAFGVFGAISGLAIAAGPLLGGILAEVDWALVFWINVPFGLVALIITGLRVTESRDPERAPVDRAGVVTFSAGLFALVFALIRGESAGWASAQTVGTFAAAVILLATFVAVERRNPAPMLDLGLFRNRSFNGLTWATLLHNASVNVTVLFAVLWMQGVLGFSALETGLRFLPLTLVLFVSAAIAGWLTARISARVLIGGALTLAGVGFLLMLRVQADSAWTVMLPGFVVAGIGMGAFNPPRASAAVALVSRKRAGMGSAVNETFQQGGQALGVAAIGALAHAHIAGAFTSTLAGTALGGDRAEELSSAVSSGNFGSLAGAVTGSQQDLLAEAARSAYVDGLRLVLLLAALATLVGALLALLFIRRGDFVLDPANAFLDEPSGDAPTANDRDGDRRPARAPVPPTTPQPLTTPGGTNMTPKRKTALITGASAGIGQAYAEGLARRGYDVVLVARRRDRLEALADRLRSEHAVDAHVTPGDLAVEHGARTIKEATEALGVHVDMLVNNAGFATYGPYERIDPAKDHEEAMVNVTNLVDLTHQFLPAMIERGAGDILNISSIAALQPIPYMAVYGASKAFILSFSEALWFENRKRGVRVIGVCPGATDTEFFDVVGNDDETLFGTKVAPSVVVDASLRALERGRPSVVIGGRNRLTALLPRVAPRAITLAVSGSVTRPRRPDSVPTTVGAIR